MEAILARRFAPFDFSGIPGFPNVVPTMHEWGDYLPRFRGDDHDHPAQHLIDFHQYMDQLDIHHEDVLLKMFMYSLEGEARQWYRSLHVSSISSLNDFHAAFHSFCKRIYPVECLLNDCCEQFKSLSKKFQQGFSDEISEDILECSHNAPNSFDGHSNGSLHEEFATGNICEGQYFSEEILEDYIDGEQFFLSLPVEINQKSPSYHDEEDLIIHETFSHSSFQGEVFQDVVDDSVMDSMTTNLLDCHNEIFVPKDQVVHLCSFFEEHNETKFCEFQNSEFFYSQPVYDEYENGEEQNFTSAFIDLCNSEPVFYEYESDVGEIDEGNQPIQDVVVHCHKTSDVHVLFQGNQVDYGLTNTTEIAGEQFGFFHQLEFCHIIYDPVAVYMESVFPEVQNFAAFGIKANCSCKYGLPIHFLLQTSQFFYIFLFTCKEEDHLVSQMLSWLHWKFDVT
jgi:hypothetical protein